VGAISSLDAFMELLFGRDWGGLLESLMRFALQWFFYALTVCVLILAAFSVAKAICRSIQWKRGISAFLRRFGESILLLSLLATLFNTAIQHNAVLEYLIFMVMWAQLEATIVLWRIEAGPHLSFRVSNCRQPDLSPELCPSSGRVYVHMRNSGKLAVYRASLVRVLALATSKPADTGSYTPLKPEAWREHIEVQTADVYPNEEIAIIGIDSRFLDSYLGKVFEVCYSTSLQPLPLSECVHVALIKMGTSVEAIPIDAGPSLDTPLLKTYRMLKEIPLLLMGAWKLRRIA